VYVCRLQASGFCGVAAVFLLAGGCGVLAIAGTGLLTCGEHGCFQAGGVGFWKVFFTWAFTIFVGE